MLILSRKEGETIDLYLETGQRIEIAIVELDRGRARIGVEAPGNVRILRGELSPAHLRDYETE